MHLLAYFYHHPWICKDNCFNGLSVLSQCNTSALTYSNILLMCMSCLIQFIDYDGSLSLYKNPNINNYVKTNLILYLPSAAAITICLHLFGGISRSQAPILCEHLVLMFKMCTIYCDLSWNSCDIFKDSLHPVEIGTGNSLGYRPQCGAIMRLVAPLFWLASS